MFYGNVKGKRKSNFPSPQNIKANIWSRLSSASLRKQNQFWKANKFIIFIAINQKHSIQSFLRAYLEFIDSAFYISTQNLPKSSEKVRKCLDPAIVYTH